MTTIRLRNTKTRKVEDFVPLNPADVRMYVCGPTVYDRAHLGNARPVVVFDVLYRLLRHLAEENGWRKVTYVRNFTDVDDKINDEALRRRAAGAPGTLEDLIRQRTEETIGWYHADMDALGALRPDHEPRATEYIEQMKDMIQILINRKHAYVVRDQSNHPPQDYVLFDRESHEHAHALFDVESYDDYGKLSGRSIDDMIAGARVEVAPYKRNPMDFVLWKPSDAETPGWDSPWGRGRPGWHIECSAMSYELLGASFDIHGGGIDLQFPHHENEIAQSACAHPEGGFAKYWLHNEMLLVEGKKMSKSLGNFFTVRDLLDQGVPGEVIRFVLLSTHYGKPMDWTEKKREEAEATLRKWRAQTRNVLPGQVHDDVRDALSNDLNFAGAFAELHNLSASFDVTTLLASANLMGLLTPELGGWEDVMVADPGDLSKLHDLAADLATARANAKLTKDFAPVDRLKRLLQEAGVEIRMGKDDVELIPGQAFNATALGQITREVWSDAK